MEESTHRKMAELRMACEKEIRIQRERSELAARSFRQFLPSIKSKSEETLANREKLVKLKDYLRKLEIDLSEAVAVKSSKDAKGSAIAENISATIGRTQKLEKLVQDQRRRKDGYAAVLSQQIPALEALEEKSNQDKIDTKSIEEAIMWYRRVLGFQTEGGPGVRFIFNKIDLKNPDNEYSLTIMLSGDAYTLTHCDPRVDNVNELITDLNKTNDLFHFVRIMREKFQAAAMNAGVLLSASSVYPDSNSVTLSSPPTTSTDNRSEMQKERNALHFQPKEVQQHLLKEVVHSKVPAPSPQSIPTLRRSPRFLTKGHP